jgi:hypothetical protein
MEWHQSINDDVLNDAEMGCAAMMQFSHAPPGGEMYGPFMA